MTAVTSRAPRTVAARTAARPSIRPASRPASRTQPAAARAAARAAAQSAKVSNTRFGGFIIGIFIAGMVGSLFINTFAERAAFQKHELQISIAQATAHKQRLESEVAAAESPDHLLVVAKRMGMVPAASPVFLRLSDHTILGKRKPAGADG